ncbi:MAG: DUF4982 domain-containing protein [Chitinophagaceae bacterium]|nr:DUF4982 domain-containing protein [Chitinophagaceae bacterium]
MVLFVLGILCQSLSAQREDIALNEDWFTIMEGSGSWKKVTIPHNWDDYYGYRRLVHGNLHGDAVYRKAFSVRKNKTNKRFFLYFEGVGSYATVILNGRNIGTHAGGRTSFTLDATMALKVDGSRNEIEVKVSHPPNIKDLPWVCGGCSEERGFSEGSQPMGIFRPVHLIITNDVRIEPFGVHAWADIKEGMVDLFVNTTVKNYSVSNKNIKITHLLVDPLGNSFTEFHVAGPLRSKDSAMFPAKRRMLIPLFFLKLWSVDTPSLYTIVTTVTLNNVVIDKVTTDFGFRTIKWRTPANQFLLNDKPVFINGIAEYEHLIGQSHAFSDEQINARMKWIRLAGFNAFRDGHQPHNLLYGKLCNQNGILWWTQLSAHVWYDTREFRENFKQLLREWVIERRNDPSVVLWGIQNESKLSEDFAKECTDLIRSLDPTASSQRLVTTCNGGGGTDWDVPQNWTGTYGGDPTTYGADLKKQVLVGEYGAWRTLDLHSEGGFIQNGALSEDRMTQLMEQKVRLAESVKDSVAGHFFWLLTSHDNPGRVQGGEGLRELDRIGPVNYKGLLTPWEEPADVYYMFRSNYAPKTEPMIYIVSHTWPGRWITPGIKDSIYVYSNCEEVELFNDINNSSLGRKTKKGIGTHFQWDNVNIQYNILYAVGYIGGKAVARDTIVLNHLSQSPNFNKLFASAKQVTKPKPGYNYVHRVNIGGPEYKDENGNHWKADKGYSKSWADDFPGMPSAFASQRRTFSPIQGTKDWKLFQSFRYGKDKLQFQFNVADGEYLVELYFIEPWLGIGGGADAKGMRLFDVAINGKTVLDDLDIWSEAGTNKALKKDVKAKVTGGKMIISFPESKVGQAIISAIAIARIGKTLQKEQAGDKRHSSIQTWLDIGDSQFKNDSITINTLPAVLFAADWVQFESKSVKAPVTIKVDKKTYVYVAVKKKSDAVEGFENINAQIVTDEAGGTYYSVYRKLYNKDSIVVLPFGAEAIIAMHPSGSMQPAYDLKPVTQYKTNVAKLGQGVIKETFSGRESAVIKTDESTTVEYPVQTGVADIYSITVKYHYGKESIVKGKLQFIGTGSTMMLEEEVSFTFTREGKWNQFTVNTGSMINAGNYTVRLVIKGAEGLAISGIDLQ